MQMDNPKKKKIRTIFRNFTVCSSDSDIFLSPSSSCMVVSVFEPGKGLSHEILICYFVLKTRSVFFQ
jgi:hypothetical protein